MSKEPPPRRGHHKLTQKQKSKVSENREKRIELLRKENTLEATVISHVGYQVITQAQQNAPLIACDWRQHIGNICAGDRVIFKPPQDGKKPVIEAILPRKTVIEKQNTYRGAKPFAANVDQLLLVISHKPLFQASLIDRYLIMARLVGVNCLIFFNKTDVSAEPRTLDHIDHIQNIYTQIPGVTWLKGSIKKKWGFTALHQPLCDRQTVITGQSGVGKSSLINALIPDIAVQTMRLSEASGLGKHSTTNTTLYYLDEQRFGKASIIDTPGVRSFDTYHLSPAQIEKGFAEIYPFIGECHFSDCSHTHENNCALKSAVHAGKVSELRYASFLQTLKESQNDDK